MRILITGATGFIGKAVLARIACDSTYRTRAAGRYPVSDMPQDVDSVSIDDLGSETDWNRAVRGIDTVVHTAARVHVMSDLAADPLSEFRRVNVAGTLNLAAQAAEAGVRRFIFTSSVKVNGEETTHDKPFGSEDAVCPMDAYAISKFEAEAGLKRIAAVSGMEVVIIRPPLVYGPGVKANFLSMMTWVYKGRPLPFGAAIHNRRSLVALENLLDLIVTCIEHPSAGNQTFMVSDGEDLSTAELLIRIGAALGRPPRLVAVPPSFLLLGARLVGRHGPARRLLGSLQVDIEKTRNLLGWKPPLSVDCGLEKAARYFLERVRT